MTVATAIDRLAFAAAALNVAPQLIRAHLIRRGKETSMIRIALRFGLLALLALAISSSPLHAGDARKAPKKQERSVERFLNGTDAERDAMLKEVVKIIAARGYRELAVVPWFVMMAKNTRGREVLLLVDPVSLRAIEIEHEGDEIATAPETVIPKLRN